MLLGGTPIAEALLAGARSHPGPHGKLYFTVDADPNGVVTATAGSVAILRSGALAWLNTDGGTGWTQIGSAPPAPSVGLQVNADIDFRVTTPIDLKTLGDVPFVMGGVTFQVQKSSACNSLALNSEGLYIGNLVNANTLADLTGTSAPSVFFMPKDAIGVRPSGIREMWIWTAFENQEEDPRNWSTQGGYCRLEIWIAGANKSLKSAGFSKSTETRAYPRRMFFAANSITRETLTELTIPTGEKAVFAFRSTNFNNLEIHVGATVDNGWPDRGSLNLLGKFEGYDLRSGWTDQSDPNIVLDYNPIFDYKFRFLPPARMTGYTPETWIRITRLKIESEVL